MKHILLLEDDTTLGQGVRFALENNGIQVELCTALSQAQSILPGKDFDLLILDVSLPDGSGLDLLRDVRRCHSSVPVILLTVNDLETDIVMGLESGADDYITKPFSLAVLRPGSMPSCGAIFQCRRPKQKQTVSPLILNGWSSAKTVSSSN